MAQAQSAPSADSVSILVLGDINLGRMVGQVLLKGKIDYPFEKFDNVLTRGEIIFANLECPVTDQHGETQNPKSNIVFCAPPEAAKTLRNSGISVVSTANNHAYDYGRKGIRETIQFLNQDSIPFIGTVSDSGSGFTPVILDRHNIRIGFLAYTQTVNIRGAWAGMISLFDSARVQREIDTLKTKVDFVIVSYHGGDEYKDVPGKSAEGHFRFIAECGADIVLGHHPHVPQGVQEYHGSLIFYSLGNAVFHQPQRFWTQRAFAGLVELKKRNGKKEISSIELIPFHPGFQPRTDLSKEDITKLMNRIKKLSTVTFTQTERGYFVKSSAFSNEY